MVAEVMETLVSILKKHPTERTTPEVLKVVHATKHINVFQKAV
jgi:hypothetical protein